MSILPRSLLLYRDDGVSSKSFVWARDFFCHEGYLVIPVNAEFLANDDWINSYEALVIPGGADRQYRKKLQGLGCENIKKFVAQGGTYFGICAGAYFAAHKVEFALGTELEVNEYRDLSFFPGVAKGPMLKPFFYNSEKGASAAKLIFNDTGQIFYAYHNGGSTFVFDDFKNIKIIAVFETGEPAIISCPYGAGLAVLSGVHYEASLSDLSGNIACLIQSTQKILNSVFKSIKA